MALKEEIKFPQLKDNIPNKISLCYYITLNQPSEIFKEEPIYKLLLNYSDIENIQKLNKKQITKFLYFNKKYVHQILLNSDKTIHFNYEEINNNLSFYFYLILLIKDITFILKYTYDSKYIKEINGNKELNKGKYYKLIKAKINIELANNYKLIYDCFQDENEEKINKIINNNISIIKYNIDILKEINISWSLEELCSKPIDLMYIEIIVALIKQKKLEDFEFTFDIIKQLNFENIDITKIMFDKLYEILNSNEYYINNYIISNGNDLYNEKKLNFYFILINYILKNPIYLYQIPFLIKTINNVNTILKNNDCLHRIKNINIYNKLAYLINIFTNTKSQSSNKFSSFLNLNYKTKKNDKSKVKKGKNEQYKLSYYVLNQNYFERVLKSSQNSSLTELDNIYCYYLLFSDNNFKLAFNDAIEDQNLFNEYFNSNKFGNAEFNNIFKKIISNDELKNLYYKENFVKLLIKEIFYYKDPFKEIKNLESELPINPNFKSIKILSEFLDKEKNKLNNK